MGDTLSSLLSHVRAAIDRLPRAVTALAMFIAVAFLTRALFLRDDILGPDESSYFIAAGEMLQHRLLYTDVADNKPPLIYFYYACAQLLGADDLFGVRLLTALVTVPLTALAASAFYQHDRRGVVAGLLFLVYSAAYDASEMLSVNCEIVMLLPLGWALVMVREPSRSSNPRAVLCAGLLLGVATLVKYQAIFWLPAIGLSLVLARRGSGRLRQAATLGTLAAGLAVADRYGVWRVLARGRHGRVLLLERDSESRVPGEPDDAVRSIGTRRDAVWAISRRHWAVVAGMAPVCR